MKAPILTDVVRRALTDGIVSIGQLSAQDVRQLNRAIRAGYLSKGLGGPFPRTKTVYAVAGFDFLADRQAHVDEMMQLYRIEQRVKQRQAI